MIGKNSYKFMSIFDFKDSESKQKFLDYAHSENGIKITREYKGCISINIYSSKISHNKLIMIQEWDSKKSKKSYLEMREKEGRQDFFETLLSKPVELDLITPIDFSSKL